MSFADFRTYLDDADSVYLYDTTLPENGAPGKPGEVRYCYAELESGVKVLQKRKLFRVTAGGTIPRGSVLEKAASTFASSDALAPAAAPAVQIAGVVPYRINRNKLGGQAEGVLPGAAGVSYWAWLVVAGPVDVLADANITNEGLLVVQAASAAGRLDDISVSTIEHCIVGRALEAVTAGAGTLFEADIHIPH